MFKEKLSRKEMFRSCSNITFNFGFSGGNKDVTEGPQSGRMFSMPWVAKCFAHNILYIYNK
jgi:hypothetical protein